MFRFAIVLAIALAGAAHAQTSSNGVWGYVVGATHPARQGNFCNDEGSAREIAGIFERFGARTGFSALSSSKDCSTRVHSVTPEALIERVRIPLDGGGEYFVSFIQVQAEDGTRPVLITTRQLIQD